jgi:hypothetical protein
MKQDRSQSWQARVDLFNEVEAAREGDPQGAKAQELAGRWQAQVESDSFGDSELRAGVIKTWDDRRNWSQVLRHQMEAMYMMPYDRFLPCADFIDRAVQAHPSSAIL